MRINNNFHMQIFFSTPHGNFKIKQWNFNQSLRDLCIQNKIPYQSMSFYGQQENGLNLIVGIHHPLHSLVDLYSTILIKADRNIDYIRSVNKSIKIKTIPQPVTEYTFPSESGEELTILSFHKRIIRNI